jgi:hypothetical protein
MRAILLTSLTGLLLIAYDPASAQVRDHRTSTSPQVRDHRVSTPPQVRDHRTSTSPQVRDHRANSAPRAQEPATAQGGVTVTAGPKRESSNSKSTCVKFIFTSKGKTCVYY